jgi:hypothetical protein
MSEREVKFVSPSRDSDFAMLVGTHWSVAELKEALSRAYPGRPDTTDIKLVLRGRLLRGAERVGDALGSESVLHIVVPRATVTAASAPHHRSVEREPAPEPAEVTPQEEAQAAAPGPDEPVAAAAAAPAQPRPINFGLMFRLAVGVMVLAQGGSSLRLALLCFGAFAVFCWNSTGMNLSFGRAWGVGEGIAAEAHDLVVPLVLSLVPTWSTQRFLGDRAAAPQEENAEAAAVRPEEGEDDEDE